MIPKNEYKNNLLKYRNQEVINNLSYNFVGQLHALNISEEYLRTQFPG